MVILCCVSWLRAATVILQGASIERFGPARQIVLRRGAMVIEGRGKYLVPGLADMHVHVADPADRAGTAEAELMAVSRQWSDDDPEHARLPQLSLVAEEGC